MESGSINRCIDDVAKGSLIKVEKPDLDMIDNLEDQKAATGVDQKLSFEDIDMPSASKIDPAEPHIKIEKPDPDLAARLEDQKPATGVKHDPSGDDTEMPLAPTIDPTGPSIKVEKPDPDLAAGLEDQKAATVAKEDPTCEDTEMSLAHKIDPTEPSIKAEKPGPDLVAGVGERNPATGVKPDPSCEDTEMPLAPKIDPNEATATSDHSDSKRSLTSFDSQDLLEGTRTQNSPDSSDTKPEGQLCLKCFVQWGKKLEPGERLLDCQITHGSSSSCNHCSGEHSRCGMVSMHWLQQLWHS